MAPADEERADGERQPLKGPESRAKVVRGEWRDGKYVFVGIVGGDGE